MPKLQGGRILSGNYRFPTFFHQSKVAANNGVETFGIRLFNCFTLCLKQQTASISLAVATKRNPLLLHEFKDDLIDDKVRSVSARQTTMT